MATDPKTAKARHLLEGIGATLRRAQEQFAELDSYLAGDEGTGAIASKLVKRYAELWSERYEGEVYVPAWGKDVASIKRVLRMLEPAEVEARMERYLKKSDPFYTDANHPLSMFVASVNKFAAPSRADEHFLRAPVIGCSHVPRCRDDQEHTKRSVQANRR